MRIVWQSSIASKKFLCVLALSLVVVIIGFYVCSELLLCSDSTGIEIKGTFRFKRQISKALKLLELKSPDAYRVTTNYVRTIEQANDSAMLTWQQNLQLDDGTAFSSLTWCASSIGRGSFEAKLLREYGSSTFILDREELRKRCISEQVRILESVGAPFFEMSHCVNP
jgi:hypothetical protein